MTIPLKRIILIAGIVFTVLVLLLAGVLIVKRTRISQRIVLPPSLILEPDAARAYNETLKADTALFTTTKSRPELIRFYISTLSQSGWKITEQKDLKGQYILTAEKPQDKLIININIAALSPQKSLVGLVYKRKIP